MSSPGSCSLGADGTDRQRPFLDERVFSMPKVSMRSLEQLAEEVLANFAPDCLLRPLAVDVLELVDHGLFPYGIHVSPASAEEIGAREGATDPQGSGDIEILLHEDSWERLIAGGRRARRARATTVHEICHAILHVPVVRRRVRALNNPLLLSRVSRGQIPAYCDPEWQAWALCGAIMMPRRTLTMLPISTTEIANTYEVSEAFVLNHLRRLGIRVPE